MCNHLIVAGRQLVRRVLPSKFHFKVISMFSMALRLSYLRSYESSFAQGTLRTLEESEIWPQAPGRKLMYRVGSFAINRLRSVLEA